MKLKLKRIKELFLLGFEYIKQNGFGYTAKKTAAFFKRRFGAKRGRYLPTKKALKRREQAVKNGECADWVKISVCVPLYNTPQKYLLQLLKSVTGQIYPNWQLCLADASDDENAARIKAVIDAEKDERISYIKIENKDIATNTNAAAALADGEYIALADHDDVLAPHALFETAKAINKTNAEFLYSDEALFRNNIKNTIVGHFKPDYNYSYLLSCNYICHLACFKTELFNKIGGLRRQCSGSQDHDLFLRLIEITGTAYHIPKVLYYWRVHKNSTSGGTAAKPYVEQAAKLAIKDHLERMHINAAVENGLFPSTYRVKYQNETYPQVSVLIPTCEHTDDLEKTLSSIYEKNDYPNFETLILENNSKSEQTFEYYKTLPERYKNCTVHYYDGAFNYSAINNWGEKKANGEYILLLNNDVEVINSGWLSEMVSQCRQSGVGAVGAMLYYPDNTVQHAGIITGLGGYAGHNQKYSKRGKSGYMFRLATVQDLSACTAACLLVRRSVYEELGGLDEGFTVAFNDVDFCLRIREKGYRIVFTPYAELYHYESKSRGADEKDKAKKERFAGEQSRLKNRWGERLLHDEYYNPNLTLDAENFAEAAVLDRS